MMVYRDHNNFTTDAAAPPATLHFDSQEIIYQDNYPEDDNDEEEDSDVSHHHQLPTPAPFYFKNRHRRRRRYYLIGAITLLVVVLMIVVVVVTTSGGDSSDDNKSTSASSSSSSSAGGSSDSDVSFSNDGSINNDISNNNNNSNNSNNNNSSSSSSNNSNNNSNNNTPEQPASSPRPPVPEITEIEEILRSFSRQGGIEFDDTESYQFKALQWLLSLPAAADNDDGDANANEAAVTEMFDENSSTTATMTPIQRMFQRFALACIYYATNQVANNYTKDIFAPYGGIVPPWNHADHWLQSIDECQWYGVTCSDDDAGYVVELNLETNALTGSFPFEVTYLKDTLQALYLSSNFFHNAHDDGLEFLKHLTQLQIFRAHDTYIQYEGFPPQLAQLQHLEQLDLSYNVLYGELSQDMFAGTTGGGGGDTATASSSTPLSKLMFLDLSGNSFTSTVPAALASLPSLQYFYIMNNSIQGNLYWMLQMNEPIEVWVDDNPELTGNLPYNLFVKSALQSFSATHCSLKGSIPSTLGQMTQLKQMWLSDNQLTGLIPSSLGNLPELIKLDLTGNPSLVGTMPAEVCSLHSPLGQLQELKVDCHVTCDCCDCCGDACTRRRHERRRLQHKQVLV